MTFVVIASTQLQLLNAAEYLCGKSDFKASLILYANSTNRINQMRKLLSVPYINTLFHKKIELLAGTRRSFKEVIRSFLVLYRIKRYVLLMNECDECIIGHYLFNTHRYLASQIHKKFPLSRIIVVDDGMATIEGNEIRKKELFTLRPFVYGNRFILRYFQICKSFYIPKSITYFSVYKLGIANVDRLLENTYCILKRHTRDFVNEVDFSKADIIILGQPLIQQCRMEKDVYVRYIYLICEHYPQMNIMYYPHPEENIDLIKSDVTSITFLNNVYSVELLTSAIASSVVVIGWYSSALINIKRINPERQVYAIYINEFKEETEEYNNMLQRNAEYIRNGVGILHLK